MPIIAEESVRQVLAATDIVDLVGQYVQLKKAGSAHKGLCPFHPEKTPSFQVSQSKQSFHCFGCGKGGDAISFVREHLNMPFVEAVRLLAKRANITLVEEAGDPNAESAHKQRSRLVKLHNDAAKWMHDLVMKMRGPAPDSAREYLKKRGLNREIAARWLIGYAPDDIRLWREWARSKSYNDEALIEAGLFIPKVEGQPKQGGYVRFRHRVMFPVRNDQGDVIAFSGRLLDPEQKGGKYVNSPETPLFNKSQVFFGWDKTRRPITKADCAIICEGQIDLITAFEHGVENMVAPLGTAFTEHHARMLRRAASQVILCFDADNAGYNAALKCYRLLAPEGVFVRVAALPAGEDPDSMIRTRGADAFRAEIDKAKDFFDFQIDLHPEALNPDKPIEKSRMAGSLAENIALISDKVQQDGAINRCATRLALPTGELRNLVTREVRKSQREERNRREAAVRQAQRPLSPEDKPRSLPNTENPPKVVGLAIDHWALRQLLRLSLSDQETLNWLHEKAADGESPWRSHVGGECLEQILSTAFDPHDAASVSVLLSSFPDEQRSALSRLLLERSPKDDWKGAEGAFHRLRFDNNRRQQELVTQRMRQPGIAAEEVLRLTGELMRLRKEEVELRTLLPNLLLPK